MPLPKAIEEAAARSDELLRQQGTPNNNPAPGLQQQLQQDPAPTNVEPNPTPALESGWEQRFKVLQGKYSAEVPRLHGEVKELRSKLQDALTEVEGMKSRSPAAPVLDALTPEEREQYDEGFLNIVAKVARANAQAPATDSEFADRLARIEQDVEETKEEKFFRKLSESAPHWNTLNTDKGFLAWLAESDGFTGRTRQELFNDAYNRLDVSRVANFFNAFGGNQSNVNRANQLTPLEQQVTPRPNGSAPAPAAGKPFYTNREIAQFYDSVRRGAYRGKEPEMARIESDIFAAQREGRVR